MTRLRPTAIVPWLNTLTIGCILTLTTGVLGVDAATSAKSILPDGSIRYEFGRRPTPELVCKPRYVCDITLDSGETILNMAIGDSTHWVVASGQSGPNGSTPHVFVKPTAAALETNLIITTNKRSYDVALRSADDARPARISFFYADEDAAEKAAIALHERQSIESVLAGTPLVGLEQTDAHYAMTGETTLLPEHVFNDGTRTYIEWKTRPSELPSVVAIGKDGVGQPLNFRVVGNRYIIDSTGPSFDLVIAASGDRHGRPERRVSIRHL